MGISTIEEGRLEMRRTYSFGERTFFSGKQKPTQTDPDLLEKANYFFLQDKAVCITFSGPVLSYPVPKKDKEYPVPGACV